MTGKKITKIISLGKKKPSTDEQTSSAEEDVPTCGEQLQTPVSNICLVTTLGFANCYKQCEHTQNTQILSFNLYIQYSFLFCFAMMAIENLSLEVKFFVLESSKALFHLGLILYGSVCDCYKNP